MDDAAPDQISKRDCLACGASVDAAHLDSRGFCRTCVGLDEYTGRPDDVRITAEDMALARAAIEAKRSKT